MPTYTLKPALAAYMGIFKDGVELEPAIFLSHENGVEVGRRSLANSGMPLQVQAQINRHFGTVFALEHEHWKGRGPSPRAQYVDALQPWTVEVPDT